jgi:hypothetical protein
MPKCYIFLVTFLSVGIKLNTSGFIITPTHCTSTTCARPQWSIFLILNFRMKIKEILTCSFTLNYTGTSWCQGGSFFPIQSCRQENCFNLH